MQYVFACILRRNRKHHINLLVLNQRIEKHTNENMHFTSTSTVVVALVASAAVAWWKAFAIIINGMRALENAFRYLYQFWLEGGTFYATEIIAYILYIYTSIFYISVFGCLWPNAAQVNQSAELRLNACFHDNLLKMQIKQLMDRMLKFVYSCGAYIYIFRRSLLLSNLLAC